MALTRAQLVTELTSLFHDPEVTTAEVQVAINQAIRIARERQLYYDGVDETISWVTDTWEYNVPAAFVLIYRLTHQDSDNIYSIWVPDHHWRIIPAATPVFLFHPDLIDWATAGKKLRVEGMKVQAQLAADGDILEISDAVIIDWALAYLHGGRGGTSSDLARNHERQQLVHLNNAENLLANSPFRVPAGARYVPGRVLS